MTWIFKRYSTWSIKAPKRQEDPYDIFGLSRILDAFFKKKEWPDRGSKQAHGTTTGLYGFHLGLVGHDHI
jgi:hypothetical protein